MNKEDHYKTTIDILEKSGELIRKERDKLAKKVNKGHCRLDKLNDMLGEYAKCKNSLRRLILDEEEKNE